MGSVSQLKAAIDNGVVSVPLRLIKLSSNNIPAVSWTPLHVEPNSITQLLLSVMELMLPQAKTTISSETHGPPHGVTKVTSRLLPSLVEVSAVSKWRTPTQLLIEPRIISEFQS